MSFVPIVRVNLRLSIGVVFDFRNIHGTNSYAEAAYRIIRLPGVPERPQQEASFLDIRTLRYFLKVAELGSFSRAALDLRIAQPALSRQIRKLEDELEVRLLYRTGRGVTLTRTGELLMESGQKLSEQFDTTVRDVRASGGQLAGSAVIGLPPTVGRVLTIPLVTRIKAQYPEIKLRIVEGFSGHLLEWLYSGRIDVGVLYAEPNIPVMVAEPLVEEDLMLLARPDLLEAALGPRTGETITMAEVARLPLVVPSAPHSLRLRIERTAADCGLTLDIALEVDALYSMTETVRMGLGFTILPSCAALRDIAAGGIIALRIDQPAMRQTLFVATASQRSAAVASRRLAQIVRESVFALADTGLWRRIPADLP